MADPAGSERKRVWDLPTRLFHWALVVTVGVGWYLGEFGPALKTWHFYLGYATGSLLLFRIVWGFVGPPPARFTTFVPGPRALIRYLRVFPQRRPSLWPGHAPLGGLAVVVLIAALAVQVTTGLFADDEILAQGPLAPLVDTEMRGTLTGIHTLMSRVVLALVGLHVAAVLFYWLWKRENLVGAMVTGVKEVDPRLAEPQGDSRERRRADAHPAPQARDR